VKSAAWEGQLGSRSAPGGAGVAALALALALAGCGESSPRKVAVAQADVPEEVKPEAPAAPTGDPVVGQTVPLGSAGGSVTVSAVEAEVNAGRLFAAKRGHEYYAAEVKACSGPTEKGLSFEPDFFILQMADKTVYDPGLGIKRPELRGGEVPAGGCLEGWITFMIPNDAEPAFVVYDGSRLVKWQVPPAEDAARTAAPQKKSSGRGR
jgi:hypothetical protein